MKRLIALLLIVMTALPTLSSCEMFDVQPDDTAETSGSTPDNFVDTQPEDEEYDLYHNEYGFYLFAPGDYIEDDRFKTDEFLPEYDVNYNIGLRYDKVCAGDDAIYLLHMESSKQDGFAKYTYFLSYIDRETGERGKLCAKSDCEHTGKDCYAYVDYPDVMTVYDGKLYWATGKTFNCIDLDGTNRKIISGIFNGDVTPDWDLRGINKTVIHRGCVYMYGWDQDTVGDKTTKTISVMAAPFTEEEPYMIFEKEYTNTDDGGLPDIEVRLVGNDLYMALDFRYSDEEAIDGYRDVLELYRWSSETRTGELLCKGELDEASGESFPYYRFSFFPVAGDGVYFLKEKSERDKSTDRLQTLERGVCKYSFETGTLEHLAWFDYDREYSIYNTVTDKYIIASHSEHLYLMDHDCNVVYKTDPIEDMDFPGVKALFPDYPMDDGVIKTSRGIEPVCIDDGKLYCYISVDVTQPHPEYTDDRIRQSIYYKAYLATIDLDSGELTLLSSPDDTE